MNEFMQHIQKANRLEEITQRIGFAIWQLQELEGVSARYFVLLGQAQKGMGEVSGNELVKKAEKKRLARLSRIFGKKGC